ncbi:MAG: ParB/RepB/Spo0J family partition protein [candidate division Zixibacteria bacterium]|nr:ParB/RepB/Spo0J family partition protein [candidate division Zixibacteria bacterium]
MVKPALGKGLGALIPGVAEETVGEGGALKEIDIDSISANPYQPRAEFNVDSLNDLALSISQKGILQPILVTPKDSGYELVAGERRVKAAEMAGYKKIPAIIMEGLTKEAKIELALIENLQREDLDPIEEARAYRRLVDECNLTQEEIGKRVGRDRSVIANSLRLLTLPEDVQRIISSARITPSHARTLLNLADSDTQLRLAEKMAVEKMTVRSAEKLVFKRRAARRAPEPSAAAEDLQRELQQHLATKVKVFRNQKGRGRIEIHFFSDMELERVAGIILDTGEGMK